jgi:hypothetical protein
MQCRKLLSRETTDESDKMIRFIWWWKKSVFSFSVPARTEFPSFQNLHSHSHMYPSQTSTNIFVIYFQDSTLHFFPFYFCRSALVAEMCVWHLHFEIKRKWKEFWKSREPEPAWRFSVEKRIFYSVIWVFGIRFNQFKMIAFFFTHSSTDQNQIDSTRLSKLDLLCGPGPNPH